MELFNKVVNGILNRIFPSPVYDDWLDQKALENDIRDRGFRQMQHERKLKNYPKKLAGPKH